MRPLNPENAAPKLRGNAFTSAFLSLIFDYQHVCRRGLRSVLHDVRVDRRFLRRDFRSPRPRFGSLRLRIRNTGNQNHFIRIHYQRIFGQMDARYQIYLSHARR